jgi:hypothetical protein
LNIVVRVIVSLCVDEENEGQIAGANRSKSVPKDVTTVRRKGFVDPGSIADENDHWDYAGLT